MYKACTIMHAMGYVDGRGYNGQLNYTICDACRLCHLILSILKPIFWRIQQNCCIHNLLRCLDIQIWQYLNRTNYFTPCTCVQDKTNIQSNYRNQSKHRACSVPTVLYEMYFIIRKLCIVSYSLLPFTVSWGWVSLQLTKFNTLASQLV